MRLHLMFNGSSGEGADRDDVERDLRGLGAELVDDPTQAERIVVWGGDGMLGAAAELAVTHGVPLGVVAAGTANDFASAAGLPEDRGEGLRLAATGTATRPYELGYLDKRPFVNVASAGLAPAASSRSEPFKSFLGPLAYSAGALAAGLLDKPLTATVDEHFDGRVWQLTVACTGAFGGGARLDAADPADRELDLIVVPARSRRDLPGVAVAMRRGTLAERPDVLHARAREFAIRVAAGTPFSVDGEIVRANGMQCVTMHRKRFNVVYDVRP
jgi:diacylglycerol kinase family enzyme